MIQFSQRRKPVNNKRQTFTKHRPKQKEALVCKVKTFKILTGQDSSGNTPTPGNGGGGN